ncbi:type IV pilin-like G/H family protein [Leptolyngbya sp. FACHB-36]|uniref:type IV pilin-like G/H family protein n=1 Tax=Leptolyngbya sp. FACHB-36 TaxID=2692808 RepID=UPI001680EADF|nr:type IV pilin-like G/H family protein [Leptolyngbya sp. FACHB-36]MBD2021779.1 type IV pilin-like G/H family protein [Leptolyngbya sp. FACHB-36]
MPYPNLLALAKQGDPEAIAALMNLALESRGVIAKAMKIGDYLHISLTAERTLNQQTLVEFTRKGLQELNTDAIQTIKIYAFRQNEDLPIWTTVFTINRVGEAAGTDATIAAATNHALGPTDAKANAKSLSSRLSRYQQQLQQTMQAFYAALRSPEGPPLPNRRLTVLIAGAVTIGAFLSGGVIAMIANSSHTENVAQSIGSVPSVTTNSPSSASTEAKQTRGDPQTEAKNYLIKMNQAQQTFYQQKKRFATNLEELERSASILSHSYVYSYKLTVRKTQSQLTATPKSNGLKSYTAAVLPIKSAKTDRASVVTICESAQPSKTPPAMPQVVSKTAQCASGSTKAL